MLFLSNTSTSFRSYRSEDNYLQLQTYGVLYIPETPYWNYNLCKRNKKAAVSFTSRAKTKLSKKACYK